MASWSCRLRPRLSLASGWSGSRGHWSCCWSTPYSSASLSLSRSRGRPRIRRWSVLFGPRRPRPNARLRPSAEPKSRLARRLSHKLLRSLPVSRSVRRCFALLSLPRRSGCRSCWTGCFRRGRSRSLATLRSCFPRRRCSSRTSPATWSRSTTTITTTRASSSGLCPVPVVDLARGGRRGTQVPVARRANADLLVDLGARATGGLEDGLVARATEGLLAGLGLTA